jgi:filamentous hemagglutinin
VTISAINDATPSGAGGNIAGAAVGTTLGYPIGVVVQGGLNGVLNPWYCSIWQDVGYTMQRWVGASSLPGAFATIGSSAVQEISNAAVNATPVPPTSLDRPVRGGK